MPIGKTTLEDPLISLVAPSMVVLVTAAAVVVSTAVAVAVTLRTWRPLGVAPAAVSSEPSVVAKLAVLVESAVVLV